jgi:hypothetical protein
VSADDLGTKTLFEQHWLQARHVEIERLALLSVYAAILSGCLASLKGAFFCGEGLGVRIFLMLLSVWGFLLCMKFGALFAAHSKLADGLKGTLPQFPLGHWADRPFFSTRRLYPSFFVCCFFGLLYISIFHFRASKWWEVSAGVVLFLFFCMFELFVHWCYGGTFGKRLLGKNPFRRFFGDYNSK